MINKKVFIFGIIVIIIISLFMAYQLDYLPFTPEKERKSKEGSNPGDKAPDFTLQTLYGKELSLSNLQGKKVFLNFWATWCGPCRSEMPDILKLYQNHDNIEVLAVNVKDNKGQILNFIMDNSYNFPVVLDTNGAVSTQYTVRGIPTTYILDENGIIMAKHTGVLDYNKMKELLNIKD